MTGRDNRSVAERIDGSLPSGPNWHQDLFPALAPAELPALLPGGDEGQGAGA